MIRFVDVNDETAIDLDNAVVECTCPQCGECHTIDVDTLTHAVRAGESVFDVEVYCAACTVAIKAGPPPPSIDSFMESVRSTTPGGMEPPSSVPIEWREQPERIKRRSLL